MSITTGKTTQAAIRKRETGEQPGEIPVTGRSDKEVE